MSQKISTFITTAGRTLNLECSLRAAKASIYVNTWTTIHFMLDTAKLSDEKVKFYKVNIINRCRDIPASNVTG
jgi:hypothetical protein